MPLHIYGFFTLDMAGVMVGCRADAYTCPAGTFGGASVELGNARQEAGGRPVSPWTGGGNVYRQRLSAEKIFGGGGSLRPRTQREGDNTPLPDCSAAAEKAFEKGRRSKRKKRRTYFQKHVLRLISCWRPQGDLNPCRRRERPLSWAG